MSVPQELIGTIPGWITAGGMIGILGIIVRWQLGLKRLSVEAQQVDVNAAEIRSRDVADERDHIAEEMKALRENVSTLRKELHDCEEDCRAHIERLQEEVWGEKRQRVAEQISLINVILNTVDAPELKTLMTTLESVQRSLVAK